MKRRIWRRPAGPFIISGILALSVMASTTMGECKGTSATGMAGEQSKAELDENLAGLKGPFNLDGAREPEVHYFIHETQYVVFGFDGKRRKVDTYTVKMRMVPAALSGKSGDEYTVREFSVKSGEAAAETIPGLAGWSYVLSETSGAVGQGPLFGIPDEKFEGLATSSGRKLRSPMLGVVKGNFISFHTYCDFLAGFRKKGSGLGRLKEIGDSIRHPGDPSGTPVQPKKWRKEGSTYKSGESILTFKGIGFVDGAACAIIGYDSGESIHKMILSMGTGKDSTTIMGTKELGDIYIDLETRWVRQATLDMFDVSETRFPAMKPGGSDGAVRDYTVRHIRTRMVSREEYER